MGCNPLCECCLMQRWLLLTKLETCPQLVNVCCVSCSCSLTSACATSYLENTGSRDHCTAFTLQYGWGGRFHVLCSLPFCSGWWCQHWVITCLLLRPLPVSPETPVLHKTVMQWWERGTKIENQKHASSLLPHVLLKISPTTFCINTNQISPINLLHLISLSTSPALVSHPQLKLPYWQMHTYTQTTYFSPLSILHCCQPTQDNSSGKAASVLFAFKVLTSSKREEGALLWPGFCGAPCERQPVNLWSQIWGLLCPSPGFLRSHSILSAQLHSSGWMFYPWLALMLSSSYCSKTAWCNIKAAAQTKHIQAGSWGGKRETLQQSSHAGCFYFLLQWEWTAGRRPAGGRNFIGGSLARGKIQPTSECC